MNEPPAQTVVGAGANCQGRPSEDQGWESSAGTRAEQVGKGSAEPWPAPALCSYCLQHDPLLSGPHSMGAKWKQRV